MVIWIDADSCPVPVRETIVRAGKRTGIKINLVANRKVPVDKTGGVEFILVGSEKDAADVYILNNISQDDMVITRDIPLAAELVKKNIVVINDRGKRFDEETIGLRLSDRNLFMTLMEGGFFASAGKARYSYGNKELAKFASCFDRELTRLMRSSK